MSLFKFEGTTVRFDNPITQNYFCEIKAMATVCVNRSDQGFSVSSNGKNAFINCMFDANEFENINLEQLLSKDQIIEEFRCIGESMVKTPHVVEAYSHNYFTIAATNTPLFPDAVSKLEELYNTLVVKDEAGIRKIKFPIYAKANVVYDAYLSRVEGKGIAQYRFSLNCQNTKHFINETHGSLAPLNYVESPLALAAFDKIKEAKDSQFDRDMQKPTKKRGFGGMV